MRKEILFSIFALAMFATFIGISNGQITASIQVKDPSNNDISGKTVLIGTMAYVYGHYEDVGGNSQAIGTMEVWFDDGSGFKPKATISSGIVNDGDTVMETYTMTELGTYEFRWTCQKTGTALLCEERTQTRTRIQLVVPEPATLFGLAAALAAFGLFAVKRTRAK